MDGFLLQRIRGSITVSHHIVIAKAFGVMVIVTDIFGHLDWASVGR